MKRIVGIILLLSLFILQSETYCQVATVENVQEGKVANPSKTSFAEKREACIEKRAKRKESTEMHYEQLKKLAYSRNFIVENEFAPEIGFLQVDSSYGAITTGTPYYYDCPFHRSSWINNNALGGITVLGELKNYKIKTNDRRKLIIITYEIKDSYSITSYVELRIYDWGYGVAKIMDRSGDINTYGSGSMRGRIYSAEGELLIPIDGAFCSLD